MLPALFVFLVGLAVGSFLNVLVFRTHEGRSALRGRSRCLACEVPLGPLDLIPVVSFMLLRGCCRTCAAAISWQYPLVEFSTGVLFAAAYLRYASGFSLPETFTPDLFWAYVLRDCIFIAFLAILFVYDLRYVLLLDRFTIPAMITALLVNLWLGVPAWSLLAGGLALGGFFLVQFAVSRGRWVGGGDIRMGMLMGFMLGIRDGLVALFIAYALGAAVGVYLLARQKAGLRTELPARS